MVAHPGHELMIHHWMEQEQPLYCCLTDGSGGSGEPRIDSTAGILATLGATRGPIYGRHPDKDVYRWLLEGRVEAFVRLADELADALVDAQVERIAGDPVEGFNPVHDVCRFVIDGAVARVRERGAGVIDNYEFTLDAAPTRAAARATERGISLHLDAAALERKLGAAFAYPEMRGEVENAINRFGRGAFALESLRPAATDAALARFETAVPEYERSGRIRVEQGLYRDVIYYRRHVLPVRAALEGRA